MADITLFDKLINYSKTDYYPLHMPGHKRKALTGVLERIGDIDITEIYDFDNLAKPESILKDIQEEIASYCGVKKSFLLVNGSTVGILTAISAAVPKGGKLLLPRNSHKSTYHGMYLRDIEPIYMYPDFNDEFYCYEAVTPELVSRSLKENPDVNAVLIVSPTYEGRIADIEAIAKIVHEYHIPLIVDEAHGAHLNYTFVPEKINVVPEKINIGENELTKASVAESKVTELGTTGSKSVGKSAGIENAGLRNGAFSEYHIKGYALSACRLGADIIVQSFHKTLPSPTQTAVMHFNSDLIDSSLVEKFLHIYQTSSPSYPLMAGIEQAHLYMKKNAVSRLGFMYEKYTELVDTVNGNCSYIYAMPFDEGRQDVGKFLISCRGLALNGKEISDLLRETYHLETEMSVREYCLAMFTVADEEDAYARMAEALISVDRMLSDEICRENKQDSMLQDRQVYDQNLRQNKGLTYNKAVFSPSEAWDMPVKSVRLDLAAGLVAGDFIGLYPPGTPILVPGEQITAKHIEDIKEYISIGYEVTGINEGNILVVDGI